MQQSVGANGYKHSMSSENMVGKEEKKVGKEKQKKKSKNKKKDDEANPLKISLPLVKNDQQHWPKIEAIVYK